MVLMVGIVFQNLFHRRVAEDAENFFIFSLSLRGRQRKPILNRLVHYFAFQSHGFKGVKQFVQYDLARRAVVFIFWLLSRK
jgi:hypothetical protein